MYDYSLVDYVGANHKVKIICNEHSVFKREPSNHITRGFKCPLCTKRENREKSVAKDYDNFINNATRIHGDKQDIDLLRIKYTDYDKIEQLLTRRL